MSADQLMRDAIAEAIREANTLAADAVARHRALGTPSDHAMDYERTEVFLRALHRRGYAVIYRTAAGEWSSD